MSTKTLDQRIEITPDTTGGKPRIAGRRITVQNIVIWHELMGRSVDEIATEYNLSLSDIYIALAYYYEHKNEIDEAIKETDSFINSLRQSIPTKITPQRNDKSN
ncbi:MAG: hypothetical protein A2161_18165 [Candidatus Schekmanbacteria bacterium RBG_13_48_7]|uniref:DUF433 domain-containing protein n=1 Tax=Candidatus Schekmanbacteria bacterium RBG_13_48_7 TaxID=1817878 RepID=A0A1F7RQV7_9BACT|nr:MAG: hypothetical protein A2161_18165 [Candidatus Schekmanbacteria bacterium RBG_13_48_7]